MKCFTIYEEYFDLIDLLSKRESEELSWSILEYMFKDKAPVLNDKQMKIFSNLKRPLDKSKNKSKNASKGNQNEIKLKSIQNQNKIKTKTHQDVIVNVISNSEKDNRGVGEEEKTIADFAEKHDIILTPQNLSRLEPLFKKLAIEEIEDALLAGVGKSFNYSMSILRSRVDEKERKKHETEPEWLNKKIEKQEMDKNSREELEEFFKNYE